MENQFDREESEEGLDRRANIWPTSLDSALDALSDHISDQAIIDIKKYLNVYDRK